MYCTNTIFFRHLPSHHLDIHLFHLLITGLPLSDEILDAMVALLLNKPWSEVRLFSKWQVL
jgi:hypothetical protein